MERLKNMGLKRSFFILSICCAFVSLILVLLIFFICNIIRSSYPSGGVEMGANGIMIPLEQPTPDQQRILTILTYIQWGSCVFLPVCGLAVAGILFYHLKLKTPISVLQVGTERILKHDLDFSVPPVSSDELGQICAAFETMRAELLKTNQELWRQSEERKRLNAAFSHDLRNPITVLKGTVKLLRRGVADEQSLDRLENYTLRIEEYVEVMSSIQRLEQMPVKISECQYSMLRSELEDTAKLLLGTLHLSVYAPDNGSVQLDHGLFLTVAENLIGNAVRFAQNKLIVSLEEKENFLFLAVEDDGPGYPVELVQNGPKPFGKMEENATHFGMGLYSSQTLCLKHGGTLKLENRKDHGAISIASFQINKKS